MSLGACFWVLLQDDLRALNELLPTCWNAPSKPPSMLSWLVANRSVQDGQRMHALGNIVVPLQGVVGWHLLFKMLSQRETALAA